MAQVPSDLACHRHRGPGDLRPIEAPMSDDPHPPPLDDPRFPGTVGRTDEESGQASVGLFAGHPAHAAHSRSVIPAWA